MRESYSLEEIKSLENASAGFIKAGLLPKKSVSEMINDLKNGLIETPTDSSIPQMLTLDEFCKMGCFTRMHAYNESKRGNIKLRKSGRKTLVLLKDAKNYFEGDK